MLTLRKRINKAGATFKLTVTQLAKFCEGFGGYGYLISYTLISTIYYTLHTLPTFSLANILLQSLILEISATYRLVSYLRFSATR